MQLVKKITMKKCLGNIRTIVKEFENDGDSRPVLRVFGQVHKTEAGETDLGEFIRFRGQFRAQVLNADGTVGEQFSSGALFLPDVATDALMGVLGGENPPVALEFAFDMSVQRDDASSVGYVYGCTPLIEQKEDDPLARLVKALPAPAKAPALPPPTESVGTAGTKASGKRR